MLEGRRTILFVTIVATVASKIAIRVQTDSQVTRNVESVVTCGKAANVLPIPRADFDKEVQSGDTMLDSMWRAKAMSRRLYPHARVPF